MSTLENKFPFPKDSPWYSWLVDRKAPFEEGEIFHLFTRGVEKRVVFTSKADHERFMLLLFVCNSEKKVEVRNLLAANQGLPLGKVLERIGRGETLVDIVAYALMPNHLHLLVHEKKQGGISKFMHKLMTAYSMYFNTKYKRSGPLFTRPFRSRHVSSDEYFCWVFAYVLLNPLELHQSDWKEVGLHDREGAAQYMRTFPYSSFHDYFVGDRLESPIVQKGALPIELNDMRTVDDLLAVLSENEVFAELPME